MLRILLITCILSTQTLLWGAPVTVKGNFPDYAGDTLRFMSYDDFIVYSVSELGYGVVDSLGSFTCDFELGEIRQAYLDIGIFRGFIFLQPGRTYEIVLPDKRERSDIDKLNPFFEPVEFYLNIINVNNSDLNRGIQNFDNLYTAYINQNYRLLFRQAYNAQLDTLRQYFQNKFYNVEDRYFDEYLAYNFYSLRFMISERDKWFIVKSYFKGQPVLRFNPAYYDLFNQVFKDFFDNYMQLSAGGQLRKAIVEDKQVTAIRDVLSGSEYFSRDEMLDWLIIRGLYDAFYSKTFDKKLVIQLIQQMEVQSDFEAVRAVAQTIYKKITSVMEGYPAPDFTLYNGDSIPVRLQDYRGYYVYLGFVTYDSYACLKDLGMCNELDQLYMDSLRFLTITIDHDFEKMAEHFERYEYDWPVLSFKNQPSVLDDYQIRLYPTYFLIDPEGKLVNSPAPTPGEDFGYKYRQYIAEIKRNKLRDEYNRE